MDSLLRIENENVKSATEKDGLKTEVVLELIARKEKCNREK